MALEQVGGEQTTGSLREIRALLEILNNSLQALTRKVQRGGTKGIVQIIDPTRNVIAFRPEKVSHFCLGFEQHLKTKEPTSKAQLHIFDPEGPHVVERAQLVKKEIASHREACAASHRNRVTPRCSSGQPAIVKSAVSDLHAVTAQRLVRGVQDAGRHNSSRVSHDHVPQALQTSGFQFAMGVQENQQITGGFPSAPISRTRNAGTRLTDHANRGADRHFEILTATICRAIIHDDDFVRLVRIGENSSHRLLHIHTFVVGGNDDRKPFACQGLH